MSLFSNDMRVATTAAQSSTAIPNVGQYGWTGVETSQYGQMIYYVDACKRIYDQIVEKTKFIEDALVTLEGVDEKIKYIDLQVIAADSSAQSSKDYFNKTKELYLQMSQQPIYRGSWNPHTADYPDNAGTDSRWDVVLDAGDLSFVWDGITWVWGNQLMYTKADNKYTRIEVYTPTTFTGLSDTPETYRGYEGFVVAVKEDGTGLTFVPQQAGGGGGGGVVPKSTLYGTIYQLLVDLDIVKGSRLQTCGYHSKLGHGGATYDIWDLEEYRTAIGNSTWTPDAETVTINGRERYAGGDHLLKNGLIAKLVLEGTLWAGKLGLEDPVKDEDDFLARKVEHDFGLQKAVDFAKTCLALDKSKATGTEGVNTRRNIILYIEQGTYVMTKTCWVPANVMLCGSSSWGGIKAVDFIPLKPHLGGRLDNYVRKFMFIFNGNRYHNPTTEVPMGATPMEQIYISPYVGGMSSISLSNYETAYEKGPDGRNMWYRPNYLKGIKGAMVFGGATFTNIIGDRLNTAFHRPGVDWLDYYCDAWEIYNYKCNAAIENEEYQFDFNGSGDVIRIEGCQFPVNHPPEDKTQPFPDGEYPFNGPIKGAIFQNNALWDVRPPNSGGSQEMRAYVGAGMQISRCINGKFLVAGYRQASFDACHFEFGQVQFDSGSGSITNSYFSKYRGADYPSILMTKGQFGGDGHTVKLSNLEFHRGFSGAHLPKEEDQYDVVIDNNYTVDIENCFQGWDAAGSAVQEVGITLGYYTDYDETIVKPLPGWTRWSPYLSRKSTIVRNKLLPREESITFNGFEGVQTVSSVDSPTPLMWDLATNQDYYYYGQYIADVGDETVAPDFIPLGKNQRERMELDINGNETDVRYEAHIKVKDPEDKTDASGYTYKAYFRPVISFYSESDTPDHGFIRLYRGTKPYQYTHYIDLPLMSRAAVDDFGTTCFGRKWKTNPVAIDTNPDEKVRVRNLLPLTGEIMIKYKLDMKAGNPLSDKVEGLPDFYGRKTYTYYGTGGWERTGGSTVKMYGNSHGAAMEENTSEMTSVWNRPFSGEVFCALPVTGSWNWDKSKRLKIKNGAVARIVRTADTVTGNETHVDKPLWVQQDNPKTDSATNIKNVPAGQVFMAVYEEKDVLIAGTTNQYEVVGSWALMASGSIEDYVNPNYYIEPASGEFVRFLPPRREVTTAIFDFVSTADIYGSVDVNDPVGSVVKITRKPSISHPIFVLVKSGDSNVDTLTVGDYDSITTLTKKASGWAVTDVTGPTQQVEYLDGKQFVDVSPSGSITQKTAIYAGRMMNTSDQTFILRLETGAPLKPGVKVRVARGSGAVDSTNGVTDNVLIRQTKNGALEKDFVNLNKANTFADFVFDGTNWVMEATNALGAKADVYKIVDGAYYFFSADEHGGATTYIKSLFNMEAESYFTIDNACPVGTKINAQVHGSGTSNFYLQLADGKGVLSFGGPRSWISAVKIAEGDTPASWFFQQGNN